MVMRLSALGLPVVCALALAFLGCGGISEAEKHTNAGANLYGQGRFEGARRRVQLRNGRLAGKKER
jgi:hypothetical protein